MHSQLIVIIFSSIKKKKKKKKKEAIIIAMTLEISRRTRWLCFKARSHCTLNAHSIRFNAHRFAFTLNAH